MRHLFSLGFWITACCALPQVAFPFNSQVPPVGRVGQNYEFQISLTTFEPSSTIKQYVLVNAPAWLSLDNSTRTLSGTPQQEDVGSPTFSINAIDNYGSTDMSATLVVVDSPAPQAPQDISEYLAKAGGLSGPASVSIEPNLAFHIDFPAQLFTAETTQQLCYYATLADHTPLPAWLLFDPNSLKFSGIAPGETTSPQSFNVELIASDVVGFAGAWKNFTLDVNQRQLAFNTSEQNISISAGIFLEYTSLLSQLTLDGAPVKRPQIANASAQKPDWVNFDPTNLDLTGIPPEQGSQEDVIVTIVDNAGNSASIILHLQRGDTSANSTFFSKQQGDVSATIGAPFDYYIDPNTFSKASLDIAIDFGSAAPWLQFNEANNSIIGKIPTTIKPLVATATITARSPATTSSETETFHITVVSANSPQISTATTLASRLSPSTSATSTSTGQIAASRSDQASKMPLSATIAISVLGVLILGFVALCFCRRLRKRRGQVSQAEASEPILRGALATSLRDSKHEPDLEKNEGRPRTVRPETPENPPQVALNLPRPYNENTQRNRESQISYLNDGEGTILSYHDRSSWGQAATKGHMPHHSMSLATEIARQSRGSMQLMPHQRAQLRSSQLSQLGSGQSLARQLSGIGHGRLDSQALESNDDTGGRLNFTMSSAQCMTEPSPASLAEESKQRRTSSRYSGVIHDPRDFSRFTQRSKSIRLVERSPTAGTGGSSVLRAFDEDDRPMEERRQSYLKRRTASQSPFFSTVAVRSARGSRAPSRASSPNDDADARRSGIDRSSSFLSRESTSILGQAIENLRRQRARKSRVMTGCSESSSSEHHGGSRLDARVSGIPCPPQSMTAESSRQFESADSFYSTDSSIGGSEFSDSLEISPLETTRRREDFPTSTPQSHSKRVRRMPSGKRSAWAAKLGRDYNGEISQTSAQSSSRDERHEPETPFTENHASLISSAYNSQLRRSRLAAETRAWGRRLPLSPLKDTNVGMASSPRLGMFPQQSTQERNGAEGKEVIGLGLTTSGDWETTDERPNGSSQRLDSDEAPAFL
ncbi:MAG: hypothetical protein Q9165_002119 [Trypethelium subeluteriae]